MEGAIKQQQSTDALKYDRLIFDPVIREYFGSSRAYNVGYWGFGAKTQAEASRDLVLFMLSRISTPVSRILDVACGLGETTKQISERWPVATVTGINFSVQQIAACRNFHADCSFEVMDATKLQFPDETFDLIVCVEAPMHFRTRVAFLQESCRVLKPDGQLVLSDMLFTSAAWLESWRVPEENHIPDLGGYRACLASAGFTDILVEGQNELCWKSFCRNLGIWLAASGHEDLDAEVVRRWKENLGPLQGAIAHYAFSWALKSPQGS